MYSGMMMGLHGGSNFRFVFLFVIAFFVIYWTTRHHIVKAGKSKSKKGKKFNHIADYKEAGLSEGDIDIFRQTMAEARSNIESWETRVDKLDELSVIEDVTGGLESAKKTFQFIVKNPQELNKQGDFLYKDLPNMVKLTESFAKLKAEPVANDRDMSETLLLLRTLSEHIAENYHGILMKDVKFISKEVEADKE